MEKHIVTLVVECDIDPSQLLDIVIDTARELETEIEHYGYETKIDEDEICVSSGDEQ